MGTSLLGDLTLSLMGLSSFCQLHHSLRVLPLRRLPWTHLSHSSFYMTFISSLQNNLERCYSISPLLMMTKGEKDTGLRDICSSGILAGKASEPRQDPHEGLLYPRTPPEDAQTTGQPPSLGGFPCPSALCSYLTFPLKSFWISSYQIVNSVYKDEINLREHWTGCRRPR